MLSNQSNIGLVSVNENHKKQHPRFGKQDDGIVPNLSEPSFEYDDMWESFETTDLESNGKHQIIMRELSFGEEEKKLELKDLLAPVFLAVAHDDEVVLNREKRTVSIADFCSLAMKDEESKHGEQKLNSSHRLWYSQPALNESLNLKSFMQSTNSALSSVSSCSTVNKHTSVGSDFYNESIDDSLEDEALMNVFVNNNMFDGEAQNVGDDKKFENDIFTDKEFCTSSLKEFELQVPGSPILYDLMSDSSCDGTRTPQFSDTSTSLSFARINTSPTTDPISNRKSRRFSKYVVVTVCGEKRIVDTSLMGNHLMLLSHGGYRLVGDSEVVILVFNAAYLPVVGQPKYQIILEQLFYYCVHAIELLVREKYEIVFFNSQMKSGSIPPVDFVKKCYETVNYRLKKNLQNVYFVHQNTWLKVLLKISQLFASSKFRRKIHVIRNLKDLKEAVPLDYIFISPEIYKIDRTYDK